jgi:hypothetical protein
MATNVFYAAFKLWFYYAFMEANGFVLLLKEWVSRDVRLDGEGEPVRSTWYNRFNSLTAAFKFINLVRE